MGISRTVAIVDDDDAVRHSASLLIERAGHRVLTFASGDAFLAARLPDHLDCVILDMQMPGRSGLDVLSVLAGRDNAPSVLVLTGHGDITLAVEAMRLGAADFLEKPCVPAALLAAIDSASELRAHSWISDEANRETAARLGSLSERQRQVLRGILKGQPNKVIAWELGLSVRTVESYRAQLLIKLGARSTADAVRIALAGGLDADDIRA
ncbi:MAG TPA: response regulator [Allosphingosinicella sp.]|nr:response regulator [Allosphingosinicella sp.]